MKNCLVFPHMGLGDYIASLGVIQHFSHTYANVQVLCREKYLSQVQMLLDVNRLDNVSLVPVRGMESGRAILDAYEGHKYPLGYLGLKYMKHTTRFDKGFYDQWDIPFEKSWDVEMPEGKNQQPIPQEGFIFVHDDPLRGFVIKDEQFRGNNFVYRPKGGKTIFDYTDIIRAARQIHCMDSCFALMIDRMGGVPGKKFIHLHAKPSRLKPTWSKQWKFYE